MTQPQTSPPASLPAFPGAGMSAIGGRRLCGAGRTADATYLECGEMLGGAPIEQFVLDPSAPIDPVQFGIAPIGYQIFTDQHGVNHVLDWVGSEHYKTVADFVEEARVMGISRKFNDRDAPKLCRESKLYLMHAHGHMTNPGPVGRDSTVLCPNGTHKRGESCAGLHWVVPEAGGLTGRRPLVDGSYEVTPRHSGQPEATYTHGVFMVVPISNLTLIARHNGSVDQKRLANLKLSTLPSHVSQI